MLIIHFPLVTCHINIFIFFLFFALQFKFSIELLLHYQTIFNSIDYYYYYLLSLFVNRKKIAARAPLGDTGFLFVCNFPFLKTLLPLLFRPINSFKFNCYGCYTIVVVVGGGVGVGK